MSAIFNMCIIFVSCGEFSLCCQVYYYSFSFLLLEFATLLQHDAQSCLKWPEAAAPVTKLMEKHSTFI